MNKKGFTLAELIVCIGIIAVIIAIIIPVTQGFLSRASILDANVKAKTAAKVIDIYLLEQSLNDDGMRNNGKYCYVAIAIGSEPIIFDENFALRDYVKIKSKNDFINQSIEEQITDSCWITNNYTHLEKITKALDGAFNRLSSCFIAAVVSDNKTVQVYYVPNIINLGFNANYNGVADFFSEHCIIKGKTDSIETEPEKDRGTVFIKKEGTIKNGRSTAGIYDGIIVGTSPVING